MGYYFNWNLTFYFERILIWGNVIECPLKTTIFFFVLLNSYQTCREKIFINSILFTFQFPPFFSEFILNLLIMGSINIYLIFESLTQSFLTNVYISSILPNIFPGNLNIFSLCKYLHVYPKFFLYLQIHIMSFPNGCALVRQQISCKQISLTGFFDRLIYLLLSWQRMFHVVTISLLLPRHLYSQIRWWHCQPDLAKLLLLLL